MWEREAACPKAARKLSAPPQGSIAIIHPRIAPNFIPSPDCSPELRTLTSDASYAITRKCLPREWGGHRTPCPAQCVTRQLSCEPHPPERPESEAKSRSFVLKSSSTQISRPSPRSLVPSGPAHRPPCFAPAEPLAASLASWILVSPYLHCSPRAPQSPAPGFPAPAQRPSWRPTAAPCKPSPGPRGQPVLLLCRSLSPPPLFTPKRTPWIPVPRRSLRHRPSRYCASLPTARWGEPGRPRLLLPAVPSTQPIAWHLKGTQLILSE